MACLFPIPRDYIQQPLCILRGWVSCVRKNLSLPPASQVVAIMGFFSKKPNAAQTRHAQEDAPRFEKVDWKQDAGLRKLAFYSFVLCIASATTGYDG